MHLSVTNEPCITWPILIDWNPVQLNHYPFMVILDKYNWGCNAVMIYLQKYVFLVKQKT